MESKRKKLFNSVASASDAAQGELVSTNEKGDRI
jgi:hypothetical protein